MAHWPTYAQKAPGTSKRKTPVRAEYDKNKNETHLYSGPFELWKPPQNSVSGEIDYERVDLMLSFKYPGKKIATPATVTLTILSQSEGGADFTKKRDLSVLTDTQNYNFGEMELWGSGEGVRNKTVFGKLTRVFSESLRKEVPLSDFIGIGQSVKATLIVGARRFALPNERLQDFRNFAVLMKQVGLEF